MNRHFNVRVYGILIQENNVLVNEEFIKGQKIVKFPGGGLEYGEGTIDCLIREWNEELDINIEIISHFYTTDFFQRSAFDESQVISIYYLIKAIVSVPITNKNENERTFWIKIENISEDSFTFGIDKRVGKMLYEQFLTKD